ncbi:EAL domain-containing protein [Cereibacter sphaeroides]|nr:EAL domain-containing protein [Cereibacter sphaeroides]
MEITEDCSFVRGLTDQREDRAIVAAIAEIARGMGLRSVAEGVETDVQRRILTDLGIEVAQDFLWSRGPPGDDVRLVAGTGLRRLSSHRPWAIWHDLWSLRPVVREKSLPTGHRGLGDIEQACHVLGRQAVGKQQQGVGHPCLDDLRLAVVQGFQEHLALAVSQDHRGTWVGFGGRGPCHDPAARATWHGLSGSDRADQLPDALGRPVAARGASEAFPVQLRGGLRQAGACLSQDPRPGEGGGDAILLSVRPVPLSLAPAGKMLLRIEAVAVERDLVGIDRVDLDPESGACLMQRGMAAPVLDLGEVDKEQDRILRTARGRHPLQGVGNVSRPAIRLQLHEDFLVHEVKPVFWRVVSDQRRLVAHGGAEPRGLVDVLRQARETLPRHRQGPVEAYRVAHPLAPHAENSELSAARAGRR